MLQARPRAWASLLQVLGAQLLQPGTQALLPTVPPAPPPTTTRGTRRRTTVGPTSNCHTQLLTAQISLWAHNLANYLSDTKQDGHAAPRQPPDEVTWSVPASTSHRARQNVRRKRCTSTRAIYLDLAFSSQSSLPLELTALSSQTLISSN